MAYQQNPTNKFLFAVTFKIECRNLLAPVLRSLSAITAIATIVIKIIALCKAFGV